MLLMLELVRRETLCSFLTRVPMEIPTLVRIVYLKTTISMLYLPSRRHVPRHAHRLRRKQQWMTLKEKTISMLYLQSRRHITHRAHQPREKQQWMTPKEKTISTHFSQSRKRADLLLHL